MEIIVNVRNVFGLHKAYPMCGKAKAFAAIAGTVTLTAHTLRQIQVLGYTIVFQGSLTTILRADNVIDLRHFG